MNKCVRLEEHEYQSSPLKFVTSTRQVKCMTLQDKKQTKSQQQ
jgi:hypothetical protein